MPLQRSLGLDKNGKPDLALDDNVSGIVATGDGTAWVSSFAHGLIHIDSNGNRLSDATPNLPNQNVSSLALDPSDSSLWAGLAWLQGVSRLTSSGAKLAAYGKETFGDILYLAPVASVRAGGGGAERTIAVGFRANAGYAGAVALYKGN
jgi:hypothetical protein